MKARLLIAVLPVMAALAACSSLSDADKVDYKSAAGPKLPPLEVPPDLTRPGSDDRYQVPDAVKAGGAGASTTLSEYNSERTAKPLPGTTDVLPDAGQIKLVRDGLERWLVVPLPAEKLWPIVRDFWRDNGFLLKVDSPQTGVMETDWAENRAKIPNDGLHTILSKFIDSAYSTGERDKFRTRLERGADPNTTEIYVSHRGMVETLITTNGSREGQTMWQPRQPDPGLEAEFLRRLMIRLGADALQAKTALASPSSPERARMRSDANGNEVLEVLEPFDRAWRRVGLALDRVGFTVEDRDRSNGQYFVRYVDPSKDEPEKKGGLLSWIGLGGSSATKQVNPKDQYRIRVQGDADKSSDVSILDKDGKTDNSGTAKRILALLQEQLR